MNFFYYYYYFCETSLTLLSQNFIEKWQNRCESDRKASKIISTSTFVQLPINTNSE